MIAMFIAVVSISAATTKNVVFSFGYSGLTTSAGAKAAADSAKARLGGVPAKVVFVVFKEGEVTDCPGALKQIATVFDSSIIFGTRSVSDANAILTVNGRTDKTIVMAIGGAVQCTSAIATLTVVDDTTAQQNCGKAIGDALKSKIAQIPAGNGKFIVLYGDCHVPLDNDLTKGLISTLTDKKFPIVGNASKWVMQRGKIYESGKNMGLLIWGDFNVHSGMAFDYEYPNNTAPACVQKAYIALQRAGVDTAKVRPDFCLVNNCRGRFGTISSAELAQKEADTIRHTLGMNVPLIGIYGSGEIGNKTDSTSSEGAGNSISVLTLTSWTTTTSAIQGNFKPSNGSADFQKSPFISVDHSNSNNRNVYDVKGRLIHSGSAGIFIESDPVSKSSRMIITRVKQ